MKDNTRFSWRARGRSFIYAFAGMKRLFRAEHNSRIHAVVALVAVVAGLCFRISAGEWLAIVVCIGAVLGFEAMNSAVEALADKISPEFSTHIKHAKDLAAAAVLFMAIAALAVGLIIFIPRIIALL